MLGLMALNPLNQTDVVFFIVIAAIIALCVAVYFLIPIFNKKQYKELRDNLKNREVAFKSNIHRTDGSSAVVEKDDLAEEQIPAEPELTDDLPIDPQNEEE